MTRWREALVLLVSTLIAAGSALPYASSSNDGSRLATVESLVDHRTLAIDDSIFVQPGPVTRPGRPAVYNPDVDGLDQRGTGDKVRINGRFYSDKPPVPAILLAGLYALLQSAFGLVARERPDVFCYVLTVASSGVAYIAAVWCIYRLAARLGLDDTWQLALTASFALATMALPYVRQVNGHILILALAAGAYLALVREKYSPWLLLLLGGLVGFAYAIEQPTGGLLAAGTCLVVAWRAGTAETAVAQSFSWRSAFLPAVLVVLGALPWALFHHAVTFAYAGKFGPPNADPAVFDYPGSEFTAKDLTGIYNHEGLWELFSYAIGLLTDERGFLLHNLALFLAMAAPFLLPRRALRCPEVWLSVGWAVGTWLVFAFLSTGYSGWCVSVRWFLPLLAGGYFLLALLLRERPDTRRDFLLLSAGGAVVGFLAWHIGPWWGIIPYFRPALGGAVALWLAGSRLLPAFVDRLVPYLSAGLAVLVVPGALFVLLAREPPFVLPEPYSAEEPIALGALIWVGIGAVAGLWARAGRWPWVVLGLELAAGLVFVLRWPGPGARELAGLVLVLAALALPGLVIRGRSGASTGEGRSQ